MRPKFKVTFPNSKSLKIFENMVDSNLRIFSTFNVLTSLFGQPSFKLFPTSTKLWWKFFINKIPFMITVDTNKSVDSVKKCRLLVATNFNKNDYDNITFLINSFYNQQLASKKCLGDFSLAEEDGNINNLKLNNVLLSKDIRESNNKLNFEKFYKSLDKIITELKINHFPHDVVCYTDASIIDVLDNYEFVIRIILKSDMKSIVAIFSYINDDFIKVSTTFYSLDPEKEKKAKVPYLNLSKEDKTKLYKSLLNEFADEFHKLALSNGFYDDNLKQDYKIPVMLSLIHSEVSEALDAYRKWNEEEFKKELADIAIRLFDLASYMKIDLGDEIIKKHEFNKTRPYKHGNKRF